MNRLEHIDYEITKACNLSCVHCSALAGKGEQPDVNFIKKVLKEAKCLGLKRVGITGGEPFLFPKELASLIDFSYDNLGCKVHIHTNGQLIDTNIGLIIPRKSKLENVTLSLLGDEDSHDLNTSVSGSYGGVRLAAGILLTNKIPLTLFLIPMSNGYLDLENSIREFYSDGVRKFRVMSLSPGGRAEDKYEQLKLSKNQADSFLSKLDLLEHELGIKFDAGYCTRLIYPSLKILKHHDLCMSGKNRLHINAEGYVFPCTASSGFIEMNVGNVKEQRLEDIWLNSEKLKIIRQDNPNMCKVQNYYENKIQ